MKIAITGSSGFIGRYLVTELKKNYQNELILLDITQGVDLCNWALIKDIKADLFIHLANKSFVPDSYTNPYSFYSINYNSTLNVLELARLNCAKVIYLSSYIYGTPQYLPIDEEHPTQAFNPYAQTKLICEELCRGYTRDFHVPIVIFRPFNIYGYGQSSSFLLPTMISQLVNNYIIVKDDRPKRDYIHVLDVVNAIKLAIHYQPQNDLEIFNIGSGISYSVKEIAEILIKLSGQNIAYHSTGEQRPCEVLDTIADIKKVSKLGWKPEISLLDGLSELLHYENIL